MGTYLTVILETEYYSPQKGKKKKKKYVKASDKYKKKHWNIYKMNSTMLLSSLVR